MEGRRLAACTAMLAGMTQAEASRRFSVTRTTASRWHRDMAGGLAAMRKTVATGRPARMTPTQVGQLCSIYRAGPKAMGFPKSRWTTRTLTEAIRERIGVLYDQDHVGRLLHKYGLRQRRQKK